VSGRVSRALSNDLGGKIVWLRDTTHGRWLYYAHLDRHAVGPGSWVRVGDTLGFVGNTGNARTTPPHLHFGIYLRSDGAVDPFYHLYDPKREPPALADDAGPVPRWARVAAPGAAVRTLPNKRAPAVTFTPVFTPVEVLAATGQWFFARLPDGAEGYLDRVFTEPLAPAGSAQLATGSLLLADLDPAGSEMDQFDPGRTVSVLGRFRDHVLVRDTDGLQGWISAASLGAGAGVAVRATLAAAAPKDAAIAAPAPAAHP
jgi:SH3-like domain-containing protein